MALAQGECITGVALDAAKAGAVAGVIGSAIKSIEGTKIVVP